MRLAPVFLGSLWLAPLAGRVGVAAPNRHRDLGAFLARIVPDNAMTRRTAEVLGSQSETAHHTTGLEREVFWKLSAKDPGSPEVARRMLADRIRTDFDRGRTVNIDGWHLSRTEADLIFLASKYGSG